MIHRVYTEKKNSFPQEAAALLKDLRELLGIKSLKKLRLLNRYDVEGISKELFTACLDTVFSEPPVDNYFFALPTEADAVIAWEYLPGQFDQRADSCAQCIQFVSGGERPQVATARLYLLYGQLSPEEVAAIKKYLINPVESREADLALPATLARTALQPPPVTLIEGFLSLDEGALAAMAKSYGLAMDTPDLLFCQSYFQQEGRCPTLTELRVIDTYWSDHCRHTTFATHITKAEFADEEVRRAYERYLKIRAELGIDKPVTLMDIATLAARYLYRLGDMPAWDKSDEVNACTVRIEAHIDGKTEPWLLLFKNETHNHPTEIEPFGGAATCIGGAIRDPLSGRGYVYQAMRLTGAGNPTLPLAATLPGKLPQRKLTATAAAGYSSYGNQIGLATGLVQELYHPGYVAKRMEVGAVVAAAPAANVRREAPQPGDVVVLLGGKTGRDGCGGATGSSKAHDVDSLASLGAEVQKGNAPEERKLQRLFRNSRATSLIKRCNDFGAGGVSVAIGELAGGLDINLDMVPKKYAGLDGTELAISESQERMAVVLEAAHIEEFRALAAKENLEATVVAKIKEEPRLTMTWQGQKVVDIARDFLDSNGATKSHEAVVAQGEVFRPAVAEGDLRAKLTALAADLNVCCQRGLVERFDSTVGASTVLLPLGGKRQSTPIQAMAAKLPVLRGETTTCSLMSWGYNPYVSAASPYEGAYLAVVESVAKVIAAGGDMGQCWLSFQEYFPKLGDDAGRWGLPLGALLGAFSAQLDLGLGAIGGKDSMSGSFEGLDVPPTLISFAVAMGDISRVVSPEFKEAGHRVMLLRPNYGPKGLPEPASLKENFALLSRLIEEKQVLAAYTPAYGGIAEGLFKMCLGNSLGLRLADNISEDELFSLCYGGFILELAPEAADTGLLLGHTTAEYMWRHRDAAFSLGEIEAAYEKPLEGVFPTQAGAAEEEEQEIPSYSFTAAGRVKPGYTAAKPRVLIPAFPGSNCEYDTAAAFARAGAEPKIIVVRNLSKEWLAQSVEEVAASLREAQILAIPGGFSGGDEPDGSGKFIANFFRHPRLREAISDLLQQRDGLICGICNGFQALIKLGLLPHGEIRPISGDCPTLTFNAIGRHQSKLVDIRVCSNLSPWLSQTQVGDIHTVAISHGEGRFVCPEELFGQLTARGQIASQYVDSSGKPTANNPNGSYMAVEAITSPDGRVYGQMGHPERFGAGTLQNVPGNKDYPIFAGAVKYFS